MAIVTKTCKKCKEQINKQAKKCPKCGANQGMPAWLVVILVIVGIFVFGSIIGGTGDSNSDSDQQETKKIEYIKVTKDELNAALKSNAAVAKDTYNQKYIEVSGKLSTIDADLSYISLVSSTDEWDFNGIHCRIKNDKQKEVVKTLVKEISKMA